MHTSSLVRSSIGGQAVVSSTERKAVETAEVLGAGLGLSISMDATLCEIDRAATGFLPLAEFEQTADRFFAHPDQSIRGWETASSARDRIVSAVRRICAGAPGRRTVFVEHGAVGSLLLGDLLGSPITRTLDQPRQGCWFSFDPQPWSAGCTWRLLPDC